MMDTDLQPFSIVSDVGFCCLLAELSLDMFCQVVDIFQKFLYQKCMQSSSKEFQRLSSANYISQTTNIWSSTNCHHSFLSLTAHFIVDSSMEKKDVMLCAWQFDDSHTLLLTYQLLFYLMFVPRK